MILIQRVPYLSLDLSWGLLAWAGVYASFFGYYDVKHALQHFASTTVTALDTSL